MIFNGTINPLTNFGINAVLWYQGESDVPRAFEYRSALGAMIDEWREKWNRPNLPFYICQLHGIVAKQPNPEESDVAEGKTWPVRKPITPGGPERKQPGTDHGQFAISETMAEPGGYISITQARGTTIHLNTSKNHYAFHLAWLKAPPHPPGMR